MLRVFLAVLIAAATLSAEHIYIGSTRKGIYLADFDAKSGKLSQPTLVSDTAAPGYFAIHPDGKHLYAANELDKGTVTAFEIDRASGKLKEINSASVKSAGPCHIAIDKSGHWAITANYDGGSVTVLPIQAGGRIGEASDFIQYKGSGPNRDRQTAPHAHWVGFIPASKLALVADLGRDEVAIYDFSAKDGRLTPSTQAFMTIPPGSGPRHGAMHPSGKFFYVINELSSTVNGFYYDLDLKRFTLLQTISTLPEGFKGQNDDAEIAVHPSGKYVYASNRGRDSIAVFEISDLKRGTLKLVADVPTGGKTPRQFEIDPTGHWMLVGNEGSNSIAIFSIDVSTGKLTPTSMVSDVLRPGCIKFMK